MSISTSPSTSPSSWASASRLSSCTHWARPSLVPASSSASGVSRPRSQSIPSRPKVSAAALSSSWGGGGAGGAAGGGCGCGCCAPPSGTCTCIIIPGSALAGALNMTVLPSGSLAEHIWPALTC
eukprot:scaffold59377_cov45-Phaeocystis_antarctica.AAC.2